MSSGEAQGIALGTLQALGASTVFVLILFIGFCVLFGFAKTKQSSGRGPVVKSLDEMITHKPMVYQLPSAPHGPIDQLKAPELLEAAAARRA